MKILHVEAGRHLYGGARQVLYLLEGLEGRGIQTLLVCPAGSALAEAARTKVSRLYAVPMGGELDLKLVLRLRRIMRREKPDLVHLHSRRGADLLGGIAARLVGVPCVLTRRVDNPERPWLVRRKYRLFDRVITISEGIRRVLLAEGVPDEQITCVRSAVNPAPYVHRCSRTWFCKEFNVEPEQLVAGMIAQFIPRKGHRILLDALPPVLDRHPELVVLLFGRGPLEDEILGEIQHRGLAGQVRIAGFRDDLHRVLPCLDLLVHPAMMEGLGVSLLQAAAAGTPIVASRAGGMPEAVLDGESGLLVPPGDTPALGEAIERLLGDSQLRRRMGERGRQLVTEQFSVDAMVEGNLAVYQAVIGGGMSGRRRAPT